MAQEPPKLPAVHEAWLPREHALHRPRHGGRQLTALICALVFFATPTLLWVVGVRPTEIENHRLAGFPSFADGWNFFTGLPDWATDQLAFRDGAIEAADAISRGLFGEPAPRDQGDVTNSGPLPGSPPVTTEPQQPSSTDTGDNQAGYRKVIQGTDGWLYYGFDAEAKCSPMRPLADTIGRINTLRQAVVSSGRRFVWVVAPDKSTMVGQHLPASYPGKDCAQAAAASTWAQITAGGAVDLRPELRASEQRVGHPVYPANDTHWADEGALAMTRGVAETIKPGVTQTWKSAAIGTYTVAGDLPPLLGKRGDKTNTLYNLRPDGVIDRAGQTIADDDTPSYRISTPITGTVDEKTLFYGDSFTKASSRYLAAGFTNLTMLAYTSSKIGQDVVIDAFVESDVVVVETVERGVAAGTLPFIQDSFLKALQAKLAQHPR